MSVQVLIRESGVDVDRSSFWWEEPRNNPMAFTCTRGQRGTATIPLRIMPGQTYAPQIGWLVKINEITNGVAACAFIGTIDAVGVTWIGDFGVHQISLTAVSLEQMFDTIQCPVLEFTNQNAGDILTSLFNEVSGFLPFPVTLGTVSSGVFIRDRKYDGTSSVWSAMQQLATDSAFIVYIDPSDQKLYFHAFNTRVAPFVINNRPGQIMWESLEWRQSRADFVNTVVIQADANILPTDNKTFVGNGTQNVFTLPYPITQVTRAFYTTSTQASVVGTFTGQPSDGDFVSIAPPYSPPISPPDYTFVTALDNTVFGQVLIGATLADTISNLADAINAIPANRGITYSSPTWNAQQVKVPDFSSTTITVTSQIIGAYGNTIAVDKSCATFSWASASLTGGTDGRTQELSVGPLQGGQFDLGYIPGSPTIQLQVQPAVGTILSVDFYGPMTGLVTVSNNSATANGISGQYAIMRAQGPVTGGSLIQQAAAALTAYSVLPATVQFMSYWPGLYCGHLVQLDISTPATAGVLLNGNWLVQEVQAQWTPGVDGLVEPWPHFLYTYVLINTTQVSTYQDTLQQITNTDSTKSVPPPTAPNQAIPPGTTTGGGGGFGGGPLQRTLLIKDSTVGDDIADHVLAYTRETQLSPVVHAAAVTIRMVGVLRKTITHDLTVRINKTSLTSPASTRSWTITIPSGTAVDTPITQAISGPVYDTDVFTADILASDGQKDADGVASVFLEWE